jgi:uncharacterized membrane protein YhaH (DUF805 family)
MSAAAAKEINFEVIKDIYIGCFKKFFVISGRARRREFWIFFLANVILSIIPVIGWFVGLATCIPSFTVGIRRLHDINRSGKWYLLMIIPLVGVIILIAGVFSAAQYGALLILFVLIFIAALAPAILLLVWAAKEGTHGSNDYGPDPKAKRQASTRKKK